MKKVFLAILAFVYIATSTGATVHMHYCMGELTDWALKHDDSKKCGKCGSEKVKKSNTGFCKIEKKFFKNNSDQKVTNSAFKRIQLSAIAIPASFIDFTVVNFPSVTEKKPVSHAPSCQSEGVAVYILHCVFLI